MPSAARWCSKVGCSTVTVTEHILTRFKFSEKMTADAASSAPHRKGPCVDDDHDTASRPPRNPRHQGAEYHWMADRLSDLGVDVVVVDAGMGESRPRADIGNERVAQAAGTDIDALRAAGDRGAAVTAMGEGAAACWPSCTPRPSSTACSRWAAAAGRRSPPRAVRDLPIGAAQADRVDDGLRRRVALRRRQDVTLMYSSSTSPASTGCRGRCSATPRRRSPAWPTAGPVARARADRRPPAGRRVDVRRHDAARRRGARAARRARLRGAGLPRHRLRRPGAGGAGAAGCWPASSTSPRPSWPTTWSAASSSAGPERLTAAGAHGRAAGGRPRRPGHGQLRPARTPCRERSRTGCSTCTTRP